MNPEINGATLITPTGARPKALRLCAHYVERQDWRGPLQWIIVDDGWPITAQELPQIGNGIMTRIFPSQKWRDGQNTLARNLLTAIPEILYPNIFFVEDDDRYAKDYVRSMCEVLRRAPIVGEAISRYYHVPSRQYRLMLNEHHASLCQTAIRSEVLPALRAICEEGGDFLDYRLWTKTKFLKERVREYRCVGLKGLPGRSGIGTGHRPNGHADWKDDRDLTVLESWIGEDMNLYREFLK